jgi:hypothetical protein
VSAAVQTAPILIVASIRALNAMSGNACVTSAANATIPAVAAVSLSVSGSSDLASNTWKDLSRAKNITIIPANSDPAIHASTPSKPNR